MVINIITSQRKEDIDLIKIFKSSFLYLNTKYKYVFNSNGDINIEVSPNLIPVKSIEDVLDSLKDKQDFLYIEEGIKIYKGSPINISIPSLVHVNGDYLKELKSDKRFILFTPGINNLIFSLSSFSASYSFYKDLPLLVTLAQLAECSEEFIEALTTFSKLIDPKAFVLDSKCFTQLELLAAKVYGLPLLYNKLGKLAKPKDRGIPNKDFCFACVTSYNYLDATFVFLHSMFKFNDIRVFKVYFVNGKQEEIKKAKEYFSKISPNIEVIGYKYSTNLTTTLAFDRVYVDAKIAILDELTPKHAYTVMCDCDMLCQGNLKATLTSLSFSDKNIFGVRDNLVLIGNIYKGKIKYINGGFIIYKKGKYSFESKYLKWANQEHKGNIGTYNEQDFINYCFQSDIEYIHDMNNYTIHHRRMLKDTTDINIYHYCGGCKPFQDIEGHITNTPERVLKGDFASPTPENAYFYLYRNYVNSIKDLLDSLFVKRVNYIVDSDRLHRYNELVLKANF